MNRKILTSGVLSVVSVIVLCCSLGCTKRNPIRNVESVDLDRYMGDWYVIAHIPVFIEKEAYNATETYERVEPRKIKTTYRFNEGSLDGPVKVYVSPGFVYDDPSNALWGMQFFWPIKADYRIVYLDKEYETVAIGRNKRDYVWIMARSKSIPEPKYQEILTLLETEGYDLSDLRTVPHSPQGE